MFKSTLVATLLFIFLQNAIADHIVGGELQMVHKSGDKYSVSLNFYFNDLTGSPLAKDPQEYVSIFRKSDNKLLQTIYLPLVSDVQIPTLGGGLCANSHVKTNLIRYVADVTLNSSAYNDPGGYYLSWERCCRNGTIDNLSAPDETGITIYLEFPAVTKDSNSFINSSPVFQGLQNIFGCKGSPFYFDFSATDDDGDSLVYLLKSPLKGHSTSDPVNTAPVGNSAPYDNVDWKATYSLTNIIHGNPSLKIDSKTGLLLVNPTEAGLFAFSAVCEEYRNGKKIGMVTRDFQFFIDNCPPLFTPSITLTTPDNTTYKEGDTLKIDLRKKYCYEISVKDSTWDSLKVQELISITPSGEYKPNVSVSIDSLSLKINAANPVGKMKLCINTVCTNGQYNYAGFYKYQLIAADKSCPVSLLDTLIITFYIKPDTNKVPQIFPLPKSKSIVLSVGDLYSLPVYGTDKDASDNLSLYAYGNGFQNGSMVFNTKAGKDSIASLFSWQPSCKDLKAGNNFDIYIVVKDDHCLNPSSDTMNINFTLRENEVPFTFMAPNLITPNGDVYNRYFEIPDLPEDYCENYYQKTEVYNRWGTRVFESDERNFKWDASKEDEGVYFYVIRYSSREYRSWVQVIK